MLGLILMNRPVASQSGHTLKCVTTLTSVVGDVDVVLREKLFSLRQRPTSEKDVTAVAH